MNKEQVLKGKKREKEVKNMRGIRVKKKREDGELVGENRP